MSDNTFSLDTSAFEDLVGLDVCGLIFRRAPTKVISRVVKSLEHYRKAKILVGVDDEMGAIRLIAAEEELVVAIFEWLKLNQCEMPEHRDFIGKFKNHHVKLAFYPVLFQLVLILGETIESGITMEGFEDHLHWSVMAVVDGEKIVLRISDESGGRLIDCNPLAVAISAEKMTDEEVVDSIFEQLDWLVSHQYNMSIREFISARADFRNKLLYAEDGGACSMADTLEHLLDSVFSQTLRHLLWALAILLTNSPTSREWGLVSQFIALYRKILLESKIIKP